MPLTVQTMIAAALLGLASNAFAADPLVIELRDRLASTDVAAVNSYLSANWETKMARLGRLVRRCDRDALALSVNLLNTINLEALEAHVPTGVTTIENQPYQPGNKDGYLDVFYPDGTSKPLPTIVWVHGGGWVSGDKDDVDNYLKILAARGYTTVGVDYTIAPEAKYPGPILQLNNALGYLQQHADRLHIDPERIVLAGDSAGSQIVAQMANIITSQTYAAELDVRPTLAADKLAGVLLNCGAYDLALPDYSGPFGSFLHTVLWAYSGTKDFLHDPKLRHASVVNYVTKDFPPAFITAGNVDPLLPQSIEFARKLQRLGVPTSTLFYPKEYTPELNHEYQFDLDTDGGKRALSQMIEFLKTYTSQ